MHCRSGRYSLAIAPARGRQKVRGNQVAAAQRKAKRTDGQARSEAVTVPLLRLLTVLRDLPDGDTVAYALVRGSLSSLGASLALIYVGRADGVTADLVGSYGLGPATTRVYGVVTADMHLPGAEAFRTGIEKVLPAAQVAEEYPLAAPFFEALPPRGDIAVLPLVHRGAPAGFVVLGFAEAIPRTWEARAMLDSVADATALWAVADAHRNGDARELEHAAPILELSDRQRAILIHMRQGMSTRDIAHLLGFAPATIKADMTALGKLLGSRGRADLLAKAKRAGL